ncbi:MAG: hypothetical protein KatS3mg022_0068 [Armatimonadota bacterium]|nr:MAG: hypothetical protein KatS3mg022_0068 [Armatimonadota bacterium]
MHKSLILSLSCLICAGAWAQSNLNTIPPVGQTVEGGIKIVNRGSVPSLSYTPADLLFLLPDVQEIPGYTVVVREYRGQDDPGTLDSGTPFGHTYITLNELSTSTVHGLEQPACRITRSWFPMERAQAYLARQILTYTDLARQRIRVEITVYGRPVQQTFEDVQRASSAILLRGTPSTKPLGEEAWYLNAPRGGGSLSFWYDRAKVVLESPNLRSAEALAQSVLYRLLVHPKGIVKPMPVPQLLVDGKPLSSPLIASLNGVVVVPVSLLQPFGVEVQTNRTSEIWTVTLRRGSRWVQVQAFGWEAQTPSGKVKLERAVFPFQGELVVPLRQVAEALGLSVQAQ